MATTYTLSEVAKHNTAQDCWLIIDGKVLDVTSFLEDHPGGSEVILVATGKDASQEFEDIGHSLSAREQLSQFEVGTIDTSSLSSKLAPGDPTEHKADKSGALIMRIFKIVIPLAILALAVAFRFLTVKEETTTAPVHISTL